MTFHGHIIHVDDLCMFSPPAPGPPTPPKSARLITGHSVARTLTLWGPGKLFLKLMVATISYEPDSGEQVQVHMKRTIFYLFFMM